jgi:lysozyme family protein
MLNVEALIDEIIAREGGFVDHPADRGGPTKYGITKGTLAQWRDRAVTTADVRSLDVGEARDIYREIFVVNPGFDTIPEPLRSQVVDFAVTSGPYQATRTLQRALGTVAIDGILGALTRDAIADADLRDVTRRFWQERVRFYAHIPAIRPAQFTFLDGWLYRCFAMWPE